MLKKLIKKITKKAPKKVEVIEEVIEEVIDPKDALIGTKVSGKTVISVVSETDKRYLVAMSDGTTIHIIK